MREIKNSVTNRIVAQLHTEVMRSFLEKWHIASNRGQDHVAQQLEKINDKQFEILRLSLASTEVPLVS